MADLIITSSNVQPVATARTAQATAAEAIDAGEAIFLNSSGEAELASALSEEEATCRGIAVDSAALGQPIVYAMLGDVDLGDVLEPGMAYVVSDTPGAIRPVCDIGPDEWSGFIGIGGDDGATMRVRPMAPEYTGGVS